MSDNDAWDADDYEPPAPGKAAAVTSTDKWEGEDEDDDVKDAWDADSDDESKEDKAADGAAAAAAKAPANKKKAKLRSKIALREAAENQADEDLTPEEKAAEKLRAMKMEENAQMKLTRDMLGKALSIYSTVLHFGLFKKLWQRYQISVFIQFFICFLTKIKDLDR